MTKAIAIVAHQMMDYGKAQIEIQPRAIVFWSRKFLKLVSIATTLGA
jgi:hypothetical protein